MHTISFPGLGIGEFKINEVAFSPFGLDVAWYGIIITLGIIVAVTLCYLRAKEYGLVFDDMIDITFATVFPGVIGARLYYVFFDWLKNPGNYNSFFDVINIRGGGLAIYGGIICGAAGCFIIMKVKKINILKFFDFLAPGVMIAQAIGRWGNFFNAEAYGAETSLPWRMRIGTGISAIEVHPTFFYESLWNLIGFAVINAVLFRKKKFDGQILLFYFAWYGFGRMFIEGLRQDSLYLGSIRVSQLLAFLFFISAIGITLFVLINKKYKPAADCIYDPGAKRLALLNKAKEEKEQAAEAGEERAKVDGDGKDDGSPVGEEALPQESAPEPDAKEESPESSERADGNEENNQDKKPEDENESDN